jgi:hypothetical protein
MEGDGRVEAGAYILNKTTYEDRSGKSHKTEDEHIVTYIEALQCMHR